MPSNDPQYKDDAAPTDLKSRKQKPREKKTFWDKELKYAQKTARKWHKQGNNIVKRYLDDRGLVTSRDSGEGVSGGAFRLNLFHSNTKTLMDMLYGKLPKVEVSRKWADSDDDVGRVAAETMERLLNLDIEQQGQKYDAVLRSTLQDRLLPGLGVARVRYEVETQPVSVPAQYDPAGRLLAPAYQTTQVTKEDAPVDYFHWQDVLWGWARNFSEVPWLAYRSYLSKDEVTKRFGKKFEDQVEYKKQKLADNADRDTNADEDSPWMKAEIWEIWDKTAKKVVWYSSGADTLLDIKQDPLQLANFYPSPPLLIANATTSLYLPTSDYHLCQDLYNEIDNLQTRIAIITEAVKVIGVYDSGADGIQRMFSEAIENELIPVDDWAMFAEGGGIKGKIDWVPILDIVGTLDKLRQLRDESIALLQQVSGMSDVMAGGLQNQYEGVGQSQLKAQFGSVRVQSLQDQFAIFAGELMQLKAEVISRHFDPQRIVALSNMQTSPDAELLPQAVQLIKNPEQARLRITIRPETIALLDYASLKADRTEFLNALSTFMQSAAPMLEQQPGSLPYMLKMLQWTMSGFKGSSEIEGVLDKAIEGAIEEAKQASENPPPDPAAEADKAKLDGDLQKIQAKGQADLQTRQADLQADMQTAMAASQAKLAEIGATHQARMGEIQQKFQADAAIEKVRLEANVQQVQAGAQAEVQKDQASAQIDVEKSLAEAEIELEADAQRSGRTIEEIAVASRAKLGEMVTQAGLKAREQDGDDDDA